MNQYNQNKTNRPETRARFETGMDFYVSVGVILIELEDCSDYATEIESGSPLDNEVRFVPNDDTMTNKDYTFGRQHRSSVLTTGKLR
jgi:hypothetical protein